MKELRIVRTLLDEMNNDIRYCHWKSNQHFSDALLGIDDLDILIDRTQYLELLNILNKLEFKHFYTPSERTYVGIEDYLGFDYETGKIIHLHLHSQLVIGEKHLKGFQVPFEEKILKNRRWDSEYNAYLSSEYDELLLLIIRLGMKARLRDCFKKVSAEKNTAYEFCWLKERCPDFCNILDEEDSLSNRLKILIKKTYTNGFTWSTSYKIKRCLYKEWLCYSQGSGLYNSIKRHKREFQRIISEIKKRYLHTKNSFLRRRSATGGILIAFLGSDGAGKSSTIKEIHKWLIKVVDVRCFYLGSGDGNSSLLRAPLKILKVLAQKLGILKITNNFNDANLHEKNKTNKTIGLARKVWIYTLSRERIKKLVSARRCRTRGYVVITDRYPQSEFSGLCDGPKLNNQKGLCASKEAESFRIAKLSPPDLAIKLIVSPEVAQSRKPGEIDLETSKNLTERIQMIQFSEQTKIVEIDANQSQEEVILNVKKAIWQNI